MELVFFWVEELGVYKEQGFHFSGKFCFKFNFRERKLRIERKELHSLNIKMINGLRTACGEANISNLTMLVGDNGVGKTTLLKALGLLNNGTKTEKYLKELCGNALVVYYDGENDKLLYRYLSGEELNVEAELPVFAISELNSKLNYVYYSGVFANEIELINKKYDISTMTLLGEKPHRQFFYQEMNRQMKFYEKYISQDSLRLGFLDKLFEKAITNRAAKVINVDIRKPSWTSAVDRRVRRSETDRENDMYLWFIKEMNGSDSDNLKTHIMKSILILLMQEIYTWEKEGKLNWKKNYPLISKLIEIEVESILNKEIQIYDENGLCLLGSEIVDEINLHKIGKLYQALEPHYKKGQRNTKYFNSQYQSDENKCESIIHALIQHMGDEVVITRWLDYLSLEYHSCNNKFDEYIKFMNKTCKSKWGKEKKEGLSFDEAIECYNHYYSLVKDKKYDFLSFNWRMSAGEAAMLNFFARLEYIKEKLPKNVVLLMDEPDLNLHPSLQQEFMEYLYSYINAWYSEKKVSIVIATHSPLLLSDVPKKNITFLYENEEGKVEVADWTSEKFNRFGETFGGDIHSLFYNSFFMEKGSIGIHARLLLEKYYDQLDELEPNVNFYTESELYEMLNNIGEPILKKQAQIRMEKRKK